MAYRARHWACALDILELAAMAASAGDAAKAAASAGEAAAAAAAAQKSGGLPEAAASAATAVGWESGGLPSSAGPNDEGGLAAASWSHWYEKLMAKHVDLVCYTKGMYVHMHVLVLPLSSSDSNGGMSSPILWVQ